MGADPSSFRERVQVGDPTCCDVDVEVFGDYQTGFTGFGYTAPSRSGRFRASVYDEHRGNDTQWRNLSGDLSGTIENATWNVNLGG